MNSGTDTENRILNGVIWKQMLLFFFPIFLGTLFQQLYNTVDAVIIGRFVGKGALAAVGGADVEIINLLVNFFVGVSSGAAVVISQHWGAQRFDSLRSAIFTANVLAVAAGIFLTVVGVWFAPALLTAMKTPADILGDSVTYLRYYFLGMIPAMLYNMDAGVLRAVGDSRRPLYYLISGCVANVVLDLLFVKGFGWGVAGAAIATSISQLLCSVLALLALLRTKKPFRLAADRTLYSRAQTSAMLRVGLPAGVQSAMYNISNVLIQVAINTLGTNSVAAWAAFRKIDGFYWPISNALNITVMTFVGQNFGARRYDRLRRTVRSGLVIDLVITVFISALFLLLRAPLVRLFTTDADVVPIGESLIFVLCPFYVLFIFCEVFSGTMRGVGESLRPALLTMFGTCVIRIAYLFLFAYRHATNVRIAIAYPMTWGITSLLFLIYYRSGRWLNRRMGPTERI